MNKIIAMTMTGLIIAGPLGAASAHAPAAGSQQSSGWQQRQARIAAHEREVAARRAEDKREWRKRQARIAEIDKKHAREQAARKADWKRVQQHRDEVAAAQAKKQRLAANRH